MDNVFREKLNDFKADPPSHLWDGIQGELTAQKRLERMTYYRWIAVAALLVLAFAGGWYFNEDGISPSGSGDLRGKTAGKSGQFIDDRKDRGPSPDQDRDQGAPFLSPVNEEENTLLAGGLSSRGLAGDPATGIVSLETPGTDRLLSSGSLLHAGMRRIDPLEAELSEEVPRAYLAGREKKEDRETGARSSKSREKYPAKAVQLPRKELRRSLAQNESRWKMGLNIAPEYASYSASHGQAYAGNMTHTAASGSGNLGGGVSVQYKTGRRWSMESGIYYAQNGQQAGSTPQGVPERVAVMDGGTESNEPLYFNTAVKMEADRMFMNSIAGTVEMDRLPPGAEIEANLENADVGSRSLLTQGEISQVFDFLEIPFYLRYMLIDAEMNIELLGGFNAGLVVGNSAFIDNQYGIQKIGKTRDISTVNLSGTLGVGMTYALGEHVSVAVEPRVNYYLNSISRNPEVAFRPFRVGVYTGLYYSF